MSWKAIFENPVAFGHNYLGPGGPHYILDKYDDVVFYRVTGAPSQDAAFAFVQKKLKRGRGAPGLRDWSIDRVEEISPSEGLIDLVYSAAPKRRRAVASKPKRRRKRRA